MSELDQAGARAALAAGDGQGAGDDAATRLAALHPQRSFIVQAPAGSGKTELLTQRYLNLLTTVEQPEQILAITFTRKAASEMRNRILQSLTRARTTPRPAKAHEAQNWDLAQAALRADQQRGWQLETHPSRLRIQTIDSLNASLSRRLPVLAGLGASMEIAPDARVIYEAVCQRLLVRLGNDAQLAPPLEEVLRHLANRVPEFVDMLCDLLACRDHWLPLVITHRGNAALRAEIEQVLAGVVTRHLQQVRAALPANLHAELMELCAFAATHLLQAGDERRGLDALSGYASLPSAAVADLDAWHAMASLVCKKDGDQLKPELYASLDKRHGFPADKDKKPYKDRMKTLLADMSQLPDMPSWLAGIASLPEPVFSDSQWNVLQALLQLLPDAVSELMAEFQARGQVDYVELALRAIQAMGSEDEPTDTALAMDARLQHILLDEFQDTSTTQMTLLRLLTAGWSEGDGRTLFCVGDPMQSIYRFRQAEVALFLNLQQTGLPGVNVTPVRLQTNFRSAQPIVNWVNAQFPHIMPAQDDPELGAVHYSASQSRPDAEAAGGVYWHVAVARTAEQEAVAIREQVRQALSAHDTQRIAILVSGRAHAGGIASELKTAGIAFNAVEIERLQDKPLIHDLLALTKALLHLADRTAWLACLRAPWCGLELADLHCVVAAGQFTDQPVSQSNDAQTTSSVTVWQQIIRLLNNERTTLNVNARARLQRFHDVMQAALQRRARLALRDWVEGTWLALHGPACVRGINELDDAQSYFARLDELAEAGDLADIARLDEQLDNLFANGGFASGGFASGGVADDTAGAVRVEIMTIHKSKGLEFDVVILPSLHRTGARDDAKLLRWTQIAQPASEGPTFGLVIAPPAAKGESHDAIYRWLTQLEAIRARHERQRLFYVATTRAKRELHLFASLRMTKDDAPARPPANSLLALLWPQLEPQLPALAQAAAPATATHSLPARVLQRLPLQWRPPALPAALTGKANMALINADTAIEFDWAGEVARHIGTVVHAELERLVKQPAELTAQWLAKQRETALRTQLAEQGVPEALRDEACRKVITAMQRTLDDARGRWVLGLDEPRQDAASEIALTGVLQGVVVNGVIDRSFVDADGTRWIIDFKTSSHEGGQLDAFLDSEVERYRTQMERYRKLMQLWKPAQPVKTALYFPLMGQWREV